MSIGQSQSSGVARATVKATAPFVRLAVGGRACSADRLSDATAIARDDDEKEAWGRPVGLQIVGRPRGEAAIISAAALIEEALGLAGQVPIDPRPGAVPPA